MTTAPIPDASYCLQHVRQHDFERYVSLLYAPEAERAALAALYAFNVEIARAREVVSDPMPGEIRFQWWRDALSAPEGADINQHPVAGAIRTAISKYSLPLAAFDNLIDARVFDLYDDPMPSLVDLEGYAGETSSALIQLATIILSKGEDPGTADVAGHAGVAYALTGLLRALPWHARRRQLYLPADLLAAHDVDPETIFAGKMTPQLQSALRELREVAHRHLEQTRTDIGSVSRGLVPAFLPVCLVGPFLTRMGRPDFDPLHSSAEMSSLRLQWSMWRSWRQAVRRRRSVT
ncbi:phytoene/squalene synthase family protein [Stappia sp. ES.058]|uniref:phytoene/squalene synthase family protein n=1 Tax=Stappia sp. ES.058 TaxID=1881061 RepID=UPI00087A359B|nr:phytoene/squalene synthase family protein [Stappia sp. ES.058]SDU11829.1 phytoene synthase [Stappia sp. ES.058]